MVRQIIWGRSVPVFHWKHLGSYKVLQDSTFTPERKRVKVESNCGRRLLGAVAEGLLADSKRSMLAWVLAENPSWPFYEALGGELLDSQNIQIGGVTLEEVAYG